MAVSYPSILQNRVYCVHKLPQMNQTWRKIIFLYDCTIALCMHTIEVQNGWLYQLLLLSSPTGALRLGGLHLGNDTEQQYSNWHPGPNHCHNDAVPLEARISAAPPPLPPPQQNKEQTNKYTKNLIAMVGHAF